MFSSLFLCISNVINKKLLKVTSEVTKVTGYKIAIQKKGGGVLLYSTKEHLKMECLKIVPFMIPSKNMKYLRINLTKYV